MLDKCLVDRLLNTSLDELQGIVTELLDGGAITFEQAHQLERHLDQNAEYYTLLATYFSQRRRDRSHRQAAALARRRANVLHKLLGYTYERPFPF